MLAVNVEGVYLVCKHGIPELLAPGGGSVINVASFVALVGCSVPKDAYTASKGAVLEGVDWWFAPSTILSRLEVRQ